MLRHGVDSENRRDKRCDREGPGDELGEHVNVGGSDLAHRKSPVEVPVHLFNDVTDNEQEGGAEDEQYEDAQECPRDQHVQNPDHALR